MPAREEAMVQQVKIFIGVESDSSGMETEINGWLKDNADKKIVSIRGNIAPQTLAKASSSLSSSGRSFSPSDLFIMIVYEA